MPPGGTFTAFTHLQPLDLEAHSHFTSREPRAPKRRKCRAPLVVAPRAALYAELHSAAGRQVQVCSNFRKLGRFQIGDTADYKTALRGRAVRQTHSSGALFC